MSRTSRPTSPSPRPISATPRSRRHSTASSPTIWCRSANWSAQSTTTKLATIVQLDPIYVTFNMSEQHVLNIRGEAAAPPDAAEQLSKSPDRDRADDRGGLSPQGPSRLCLAVNSTRRPARSWCAACSRIPIAPCCPASSPASACRGTQPTRPRCSCPTAWSAEDQAGNYLLVVNKDDIVEQRRVTTGKPLPGGLREITAGLSADDRVVVSTNGRAIPGKKVVPQATPSPQGRPAQRTAEVIGSGPAMISKFFIDRPVLANVLAIVIVLIGGVGVLHACRSRSIPTSCRRRCR